jgi:hypothetical protein
MGRWACGVGLAVATTLLACGRQAYRPLASGQVGTVVVTVSSPTGKFTSGDNDVQVTFRDPDGQPLRVDSPAIVLLRKDGGNFKPATPHGQVRTRGAGIYLARTGLDRPGPWQGTVSWYRDGTPHQWTFTTTAE